MADVERNKRTAELVYDAFRSGEVDALDDLIVPEYIQHHPEIPDGLQAAKDFLAPFGAMDIDVHRMIGEGDLLAVHSHTKTMNGEPCSVAAVDLFRFNDDAKIVEHWEVYAYDWPDRTPSGNDMFSQIDP